MNEWQIVIAILGGLVAGFINTFAGNGSAITLSILTEVMGLPGNVANGSNRIGAFFQSTSSTFAFYKNGKLDLKRSKSIIILTCIGALIGVWVAINISNEQFKFVFKYLMVMMLIVILVNPKRWLRNSDTSYTLPMYLQIPIFLALGFYGGFIQMGMGIIFLAVMVLGARYSIMNANAVKSIVITIYTFFVILIFEYKGLIDWQMGCLMAIGQTAGGWLTAIYGSKYKNANVWAHRLLVVIVVAAIIKMYGVLEWISS